MGALIGDAFGVPFEFKPGHDIPAELEFIMPDTFRRSHGGVPYGCWSDDGSQMLCLLETLLINPESLDIHAFSSRLLRWFESDYHQSGGKVFDCGLATASSLRLLASGVSPMESGQKDIRSNGNGSLMRTLPVAVVAARNGYDEDWVIKTAMLQSIPTHAHDQSLACCAVYSLLAYRMLLGKNAETKEVFGTLHEKLPAMAAALDYVQTYGSTEIPNGTGYVINSLWSSIHCLKRANSYREAVENAVRLGNDTDTTACITGGLAGIRWGIGDPEGIPEEWIFSLRVPSESNHLLSQLR